MHQALVSLFLGKWMLISAPWRQARHLRAPSALAVAIFAIT